MKRPLRIAFVMGIVALGSDSLFAQGNWGMLRPPREGRRWAFNLRDAQDGYPLGTREPWHYGYNMNDVAAGYFGGGNYTQYYAYGRGGAASIGNFPDSLPGPIFYRDPRRSPYLHQLPIFTNPLADPTDRAGTPKKDDDKEKIRKEENQDGDAPAPLGALFDSIVAGEKDGQPAKEKTAPKEKPSAEKNDPTLAYLTVLVPDDAQVWLEETLMTQKGDKREFVTPKLDVGMLYQYRVKAKWYENGRAVEREKNLVLQGGEKRTIDLRSDKPAAAAIEKPALSEPRSFPKLETEGD
jgi:uncharacterized protein (TIGR03000 family)